MTNYKGTQVLYTNEYGESIKTIADVDSDGTVYFQPNEHGLVMTAKLESLIAHGQLLEADWELNADKLHDAIEQARTADEIAADAGWLGTGDVYLDRLNKVAGGDIVSAICTKTPERVEWEREYIEKRSNTRPLYEVKRP